MFNTPILHSVESSPSAHLSGTKHDHGFSECFKSGCENLWLPLSPGDQQTTVCICDEYLSMF